MSQTQAVTPFEAAGKPETLQDLLKRDAYRNRFDQVLGERAPQFISSILSIGATMRDVEPRSVIASAAIAASLNLPIDKNLGFAWIVPYKKNGVKYASFQMGYRGLINLAQRTAAYERLNAAAVNEEAYKGRDVVGEPIIDWEAVDEEKPVAGYVFAFKMTNGFTKVAYWSKKKVEQHAKQYSQAYRSDYDTPWKTHFDSMALKTVVKNELSRWGMLSVEMQGAFANDNSVHRDIDAPAEFPEPADEIARPVIDSSDGKTEATPESDYAPAVPSPKKTKPAPAKAPVPTPTPAPQPEPEPTTPEPAPLENLPSNELEPGPATLFPETEVPPPHYEKEPYDTAIELMEKEGIQEATVLAFLKRKKFTAATTEELRQVADNVLADMCTPEHWKMVSAQCRIDQRAK